MNKLMKKVIAAMLGGIMTVCSCIGAAAAEERTINIAYTAIPDGLIQRLHSPGVPESIAYAQISDTLIVKDSSGEYQPRMAESWEVNEDSTEFTFHLRQDMTWSDGEPVTADDIVFTMNMLKEASGYTVVVADLDTAEAVDEYTVKLTLVRPNVVFMSTLATPMYGSIMPAHGDEQWGEDYGTSVDTTLSCGPYVLTDWQPNVSMTFEANPDYFLGEPDIKEVVYHEMQDTNAAVVALQTGDMDVWFNPITGTAYETLTASDNIAVEEYVSGRNEAVYMYTQSGTFSDVRMRQAVAYAINPEEALAVGADGLGVLVSYPGDIGAEMSGNPDYDSEYAFTYDLDKAKELVAECGMEGADVVVKCYNTEPYATLGVWLQGVLVNMGLNATVEPMERAAFLEEMRNEQVEIMPLSWVGQTYDLDEVMAGAVYSANGGSSNYSFYDDPDMDALVEASRGESDPEARKEIYKEIIDKFLQDAPFVPLYAVTFAIPHSTDLVCDNAKSYSMFDYHWAE